MQHISKRTVLLMNTAGRHEKPHQEANDPHPVVPHSQAVLGGGVSDVDFDVAQQL